MIEKFGSNDHGKCHATHAALIALALGLTCSTGCAGGSAARRGASALPLGIYRVVERHCDYRPAAPEDCSQARFLELRRDRDPESGALSTTLRTWLSDDPTREHVYNTRDIGHGAWRSNDQFWIEEDGYGRELLTVASGVLVQYEFIRAARITHAGDMAGSTRLRLVYVPWTPALASLLPTR